ncbi:MAG: alpha/beta fold hydrolase [Alphaproteobacteria bacterium]|jgi:pimeloyl-ACP methyl ester carboxylesterase|nr:alpha/beta fold hydrolase [Alphaproteobacteria bacterium]MDP6566551.1 alpha/beta fold hydrolase [Alphaproteobacteria bacterium]MDP6815912.1 alpha/beta fold hydrolase [Alphaproteobacteria bacterium]
MLPHYEVHDGDGPYLLLLHGMLSSRAQWMLNVAALTEFCRPVVMELFAHGRSPSPEDPQAYHPDSYLRTFERIRRELGVERWFVCGQSFGAGLTLRYALEHPERVVAQIFTNSSSALADAEMVAAYRDNSENRARAMEQGGHDFIAELPIHPARARRLPVEVRDALVRDTELLDPAGLARAFRHSSPHLSVRERIGENVVPTLLVCGEREERFAGSRQFAEANMPELTVVGADAGHAVNIEAADVFNQAVADLIQRHGGAVE